MRHYKALVLEAATSFVWRKIHRNHINKSRSCETCHKCIGAIAHLLVELGSNNPIEINLAEDEQSLIPKETLSKVKDMAIDMQKFEETPSNTALIDVVVSNARGLKDPLKFVKMLKCQISDYKERENDQDLPSQT